MRARYSRRQSRAYNDFFGGGLSAASNDAAIEFALRRIGPALVFERLWKETGAAARSDVTTLIPEIDRLRRRFDIAPPTLTTSVIRSMCRRSRRIIKQTECRCRRLGGLGL